MLVELSKTVHYAMEDCFKGKVLHRRRDLPELMCRIVVTAYLQGLHTMNSVLVELTGNI